MEKTNLILIAGALVLAASASVAFKESLDIKNLQREKLSLEQEKVSYEQKIREIKQENSSINSKIAELNKEIERISHDKDETEKSLNQQKENLEHKYGTIVKERDELVAKIKEKPTPQTDDGYWASILKSKADLEIQLEKLRFQLKETKVTKEQVEREKTNSDTEIQSLSTSGQQLEQEISYNQKMIDTLAAELTFEKNARRQSQDAIKSLKSENFLLKRQLKNLSDQKTNVDKKLLKAEADRATLERRFNEMGIFLEDRLAGISGLKQELGEISGGSSSAASKKETSIQLPPIIVQSLNNEDLPSGKTTKESFGKVVTINKENNFVVIDSGSREGINSGRFFKVERDGQEIGEIEVIEVRSDISACDIKKEIYPIEVGDRIIR